MNNFLLFLLLLQEDYEADLPKENPVVIYCGGFMQLVRKRFSEEGSGGRQ